MDSFVLRSIFRNFEAVASKLLHLGIKKEWILLFCARFFVILQPQRKAPVVQWIEQRFPKPSIRVRFPAGVLSAEGISENLGSKYK